MRPAATIARTEHRAPSASVATTRDALRPDPSFASHVLRLSSWRIVLRASRTRAKEVGGGRRRGRKVCAVFAQTGLCGAKSEVRPAFFFRRADRLRTRAARIDRCGASAPCAFGPAVLFSKRDLFSALSFAMRARRRRAPRTFVVIARAAEPDRTGGAAAGDLKKFRRGVLTVEKTVIRFRPTDVAAEASESAHSENTQHKKDLRPELLQGGCRHRLRCENENPSFRTPASPRAAGVFVLPGPRTPDRAVPAESVPARLSRWRLCAGPIPARCLSTGQ